MDKKVAIFDIGSNSVRLFLTDGICKIKRLITTRLISGISEDGYLSSDSIMKTFSAIKELKSQAEIGGATEFYAFATEAVRKAVNGQALTDMVYSELNMKVEVLSGKKEALIGLKGAVLGDNGGIIDIGGASCEVAYMKNGEISYLKSIGVGAVWLFNKFKRDKAKIDEFLSNKVKEFDCVDFGEYYAIGGTNTSLSAINLGLKVYDSNKTHGNIITVNDVELMVEKLYSLSVEEIAEKYPVSTNRAEIIAGGASILLFVMKRLKIDRITVSENDNLEGYYFSVFKKN